MPGLVYILCGIASLASAGLLIRAAKGPARRLLLWNAVFFVGLALNNAALYADSRRADVDWTLIPNLIALVSVMLLVYALIWETT